ncbi:hypothetical protein CcaverHIS002_0303460 [Cutaneotrichosporon cavernicola]|uniref:Zn(2)-C6 fungal-type domain-containing protein n=1 Tax=Cutaneotrichosporon cavernicola TaxID=279322 RepID=A0AA48L1V4_9TREE|nr:uncharacterized protein CcaverHIS019_0303450 [Cutaneotrichosporon cavernicola]BEI82478.1 hypothetical protein CcaverHIS002_0303460 [Cutaneotrichosporon cavernicola]BEI90275.1 hypothetical protein CcaverHIS019_0303450 [Cutaneotrichosporon cavernicola]BEI98052.1 hypothetical protein CcaverHIS631_0303510 [Cutaneotrichosporon cavernicola]BEJ05829.1 hypothetical protein CcaverHIS641_0303510 [Cutaneotrichosporon cavernicola]
MSESPPAKRHSPDPAGGGTSASQKRTRSRNGCLVCRARRIKCDLERPECKRCVNYGAECVYPIKKAFDAAAVDAALGSRHNRPSSVAATAAAFHDPNAGPSRSSAVSPPLPLILNNQPARADMRSTVEDLPPMEMVHALFRKTKMGSFFNNPGMCPPEFLQHVFPNPDDLRCFHHCLTYTLSLMVIDEEHNPWVEHIAPMFLFPTGDAPLSTSALKFAMLAIGATHLAYLEATSRVSPAQAENTLQMSRQYRHTALGLLRQARRIPGELSNDAFLAASLLIVDNDILAATVSWREPLRYAKASIAHRGGAGNVLFGQDWRTALAGRVNGGPELAPPLSARRYLIEHAVMHDLLSCLTSGAPPTILDNDSPWWEALGTTGGTDREWESIEALVGYDRSLMRIVGTILALYSEWRAFEAHYRPLNELDPAVSLHSPAAMERMELSRRLADCQIELATWRAEAPARYMDQRTMVGSMALWHEAQIIVLRDMQKRGRDDADVQSSAAAVLELCIEAGDKVEFLNWPFSVACSVLLDPDKRETARGIIKTFAYQCCHEIESVRVLVEEMWRRIDEGYDDEACNWREVLLEIGRPVLIG